MPEPSDPERLRHEALQRELEAAQRRRDSYQALLKDLPQIFEGKFRERLRPLLQRNEQLQLEGLALREQIRRALPAESPGGRAALPPEPPGAQASAVSAPPSRTSATAAAPAVPAAPLPAEPFVPAGASELDHWRPSSPPPAPSPRPDRAAERRTSWFHRLWLERPARPWLLAAGVVLGCAVAFPLGQSLLRGGAAGPGQRSGRPAAATAPRIAQPAPVAPGTLRLSSREPSWLEVESLDGRVLFFSHLQGERSFPVGEGIRVRSGRPDLILVRWPGGSERILGTVNEDDWQTFMQRR